MDIYIMNVLKPGATRAMNLREIRRFRDLFLGNLLLFMYRVFMFCIHKYSYFHKKAT
jgi:hypothetical protein